MPFLCTGETSVGQGPEGTHIAPVRCKRWSCPHCHGMNRARVIAIARAAKPKAMLTLTVAPLAGETPDEAAQRLKEGLRLLRLRLKRHPRLENFEFLAVFERHKSGFPHLHLLIKGSFLPWRLMRRWWEEITGSHQVDIRKIDTRGKAAFYVSKYIGKDLSAFEGCKRWWRSHGYSEGAGEDYVPAYRHTEFSRAEADYNRLRFALVLDGWKMERIDGGRELARPPPGDHYPFDFHLQRSKRPVGWDQKNGPVGPTGSLS